MGKASRKKFEGTRQAKIAAQRAAAKRAEQRRRLLIGGGAIVVVVAVVLALVLVKLNAKSGTAASASEGPTGASLTSLVNQVTGVPSSTLDTVGGGSIDPADVGAGTTSNGSYLAPVTGTTLTSGGKPEFLYIGAEYCPYCAAERWAMIVALSRFGTFSGLSTIHSSSTDTPSNVPTFTFYGSTYTSKYLSFSSVEETKNYRIGNSTSTSVNYVTLQTPTTAQQALITQYDPGTNGQGGSIPFIDIGNKYVEVGNLAGYGPTNLSGLTWSQIGADLSNPSSAVAKGIDGSANYLTAAICKLTGNQPASACTPAVKALEAKL
jgi:thiol-disulfide isomerase/thioredoxin